MEYIGIIPSRYASTRFPGKPLAMIDGKTMVQRVYEQAVQALKYVYVATDDKRIIDEVEGFGGNVIYTRPENASGTDRCAEALKKIEEDLQRKFQIVVNIQGDEPFIQPGQILRVCECFSDDQTQIATLVKKFGMDEDIFDPNKVKVVFNSDFFALYFSRSVIPYLRNTEKSEWVQKHNFYKHIGMYAYRKEVLYAISKLSPSGLERGESLEQLRWLENGYRIKVEPTEFESMAIDTPEDIKKLMKP